MKFKGKHLIVFVLILSLLMTAAWPIFAEPGEAPEDEETEETTAENGTTELDSGNEPEPPAETDPPVNDPPVNDPPVNDPPVNDPPANEPADPPATDPVDPADPPAIDAPATTAPQEIVGLLEPNAAKITEDVCITLNSAYIEEFISAFRTANVLPLTIDLTAFDADVTAVVIPGALFEVIVSKSPAAPAETETEAVEDTQGEEGAPSETTTTPEDITPADDQGEINGETDDQGEVNGEADDQGEVNGEADDQGEVNGEADDQSEVNGEADDQGEVNGETDDQGEVNGNGEEATSDPNTPDGAPIEGNDGTETDPATDAEKEPDPATDAPKTEQPESDGEPSQTGPNPADYTLSILTVSGTYYWKQETLAKMTVGDTVKLSLDTADYIHPTGGSTAKVSFSDTEGMKYGVLFVSEDEEGQWTVAGENLFASKAVYTFAIVILIALTFVVIVAVNLLIIKIYRTRK